MAERLCAAVAGPRYGTWLDTSNDDVDYLFEPYPANQLKAIPVDPIINKASNEGAEYLKPLNSL
jgi:putative SOS response-associated peptidase YedK